MLKLFEESDLQQEAFLLSRCGKRKSGEPFDGNLLPWVRVTFAKKYLAGRTLKDLGGDVVACKISHRLFMIIGHDDKSALQHKIDVCLYKREKCPDQSKSENKAVL